MNNDHNNNDPLFFFDKLTLLTMEETVFDALIDNFREEDEIFFGLQPQGPAVLTSRGANARQLRKLSTALLRSGLHHVGEMELEGGAYCQRGTDVTVVQGLCQFLQRERVVVDCLKLQADDDDDEDDEDDDGIDDDDSSFMDYAIPNRLLEAYAENGTPRKTLHLEGFDLTKLSQGLASLIKSGTLHALHVEGGPGGTHSNNNNNNNNNKVMRNTLSLQQALGSTTTMTPKQNSPNGLQHVYLRDMASSDILQATLAGLAGNTTLLSLHMEHVRLVPSHTAALCRVLETCSHLQRIVYRQEELSIPVLHGLAKQLQPGISKVTSLDVSHAGLESGHVEALKQLIQKLPKVVELNLNDNRLGCLGLGQVCRLLHTNKSMEKVSWNGNDIPGESMVTDLTELFASTSENVTLQSLSLDANHLLSEQEQQQEGQARMCQAFLQSNHTDLTIHLTTLFDTAIMPSSSRFPEFFLTVLDECARPDGDRTWTTHVSCQTESPTSHRIGLVLTCRRDGVLYKRQISILMLRSTTQTMNTCGWFLQALLKQQGNNNNSDIKQQQQQRASMIQSLDCSLDALSASEWPSVLDRVLDPCSTTAIRQLRVGPPGARTALLLQGGAVASPINSVVESIVASFHQWLPIRSSKLASLEFSLGQEEESYVTTGVVETLRQCLDANRSLTRIVLTSGSGGNGNEKSSPLSSCLIPTDYYALRNLLADMPHHLWPLADSIATAAAQRHDSGTSQWSLLEHRLHAGFWAAKLLVHRPVVNQNKRKACGW